MEVKETELGVGDEGRTLVVGPSDESTLPGKTGPLAVSIQGIRALHSRALGLCHHLPTRLSYGIDAMQSTELICYPKQVNYIITFWLCNHKIFMF